MFGYDSGKYLLFYTSSFVRPNAEKNRLVFALSLKRNALLIVVLLIEIIKNSVLIAVPMRNNMRYIV